MKEPTAEDWVIARLLMFGFNVAKDAHRIGLDAEFIRSVLYLNKRVGMECMGEMFTALREERKTK